ncbi:hypothetical protein TNCV_3206571 [Trichonephila clavipes]|nr:hypothetical protein TNCV_3206571 [Trichonephila clavipes]
MPQNPLRSTFKPELKIKHTTYSRLSSLSGSDLRECHRRFREDRESVEDDECSGRQQASSTSENIKKVSEMVLSVSLAGVATIVGDHRCHTALIQRGFGCVLGVQQTKQLPHIVKVDLVWQLGV